MKTSFFRVMLLFFAGSSILLLSYLPYGANPLLTLTGVSILFYAMVLFFKGDDMKEKTPEVVPADACRSANHAGCQDDPACVCGCHRERIEVMIDSF